MNDEWYENSDRDIVSSRKKIPTLSFLGCAFFVDLSRMRYSNSIGTLESYK